MASGSERFRIGLVVISALVAVVIIALMVWSPRPDDDVTGETADAPEAPMPAITDEADVIEPVSGTEVTQTDPQAVEQEVADAPRTEEGGYSLYHRGLYEEALQVWREAADEGDAGAAYRLGATYMDGQVVPFSAEKGLEWLQRAAEMGDARAMGDLGSAYDWGLGKALPSDQAKAAEWYEKGAVRGHPASQYNLGVLYEEGVGVEQDYVKAYMYYYLANKNGFPKYPAEAIEKLTPKMTNSQIKEAVDAARSFEPI